MHEEQTQRAGEESELPGERVTRTTEINGEKVRIFNPATCGRRVSLRRPGRCLGGPDDFHPQRNKLEEANLFLPTETEGRLSYGTGGHRIEKK